MCFVNLSPQGAKTEMLARRMAGTRSPEEDKAPKAIAGRYLEFSVSLSPNPEDNALAEPTVPQSPFCDTAVVGKR